jgi:hypothetical protein
MEDSRAAASDGRVSRATDTSFLRSRRARRGMMATGEGTEEGEPARENLGGSAATASSLDDAYVPPARLSTTLFSLVSRRLATHCLSQSHRAPFATSSVLSARFFPKQDPTAMDVQQLTARLSSLGLAATPAPGATVLETYFYTPKSGSPHPVTADLHLKLVVVAIEANKNVGAAKALAGSVGLKDMRAIGGKDLTALIGRERTEGECRRSSRRA